MEEFWYLERMVINNEQSKNALKAEYTLRDR